MSSTTTTNAELVTVFRGNGRAVHAGYFVGGSLVGTYCARNVVPGSPRVRQTHGGLVVDCKACLRALPAAPVAEPVAEPCDACKVRPAGHGHFALYCEPCSVLPYGQAAPVDAEPTAGDVNRGKMVRAALSGHSKRCLAAAMICAVENVRDSAEHTVAELATVDYVAWAVGYLDDGLTACMCEPGEYSAPVAAEPDVDAAACVAAGRHVLSTRHASDVCPVAEPVAPMIHATDSDGKRMCGSGRGARSINAEIVTCAVCLAAVSVAPYETAAPWLDGWQPVANVTALRNAMEIAGLRYSELADHVADVDAGHIVTADNGRQWRRAAKIGGTR